MIIVIIQVVKILTTGDINNLSADDFGVQGPSRGLFGLFFLYIIIMTFVLHFIKSALKKFKRRQIASAGIISEPLVPREK
jgi:hypothetical protein